MGIKEGILHRLDLGRIVYVSFLSAKQNILKKGGNDEKFFSMD